MEAKKAEGLLDNWLALNAALPTLTRSDVVQLLGIEARGRKRKSVLLRLYGRWSKMRAADERKALLEKGRLPWA